MNNKEYVSKVNASNFPKDVEVPLDTPFIDQRGTIQNIWLGQSGSITIIDSKKGSIRAKHKHTEDWHATYILSGRVKYIEGEPNIEQVEKIFESGSLFFTRPDIYHIMEFLEDTKIITINGILKDHDSYNKDVVRY